MVWEQVLREGAWGFGCAENSGHIWGWRGYNGRARAVCVSCMDLALDWAEPNGRELELKGLPRASSAGQFWGARVGVA